MRLFEEFHKRLYLANILIDKLEMETSILESDDKLLPTIIEKAYQTQLKMLTISEKWDNPTEFREPIKRLDDIIKKLEILQNAHVNDM
jgi:hypothetical protein